MKLIAEALWKSANAKHPISFERVDIEELSLTGNMKLSEMRERKVQWKTVDDEVLGESKLSYETEEWMTIEP